MYNYKHIYMCVCIYIYIYMTYMCIHHTYINKHNMPSLVVTASFVFASCLRVHVMFMYVVVCWFSRHIVSTNR